MMLRAQELQEECDRLRQNAQGVAGNPAPVVPPGQAPPAAGQPVLPPILAASPRQDLLNRMVKKTAQDNEVLEAALPSTSVQAINGWARARLSEPAKRERHGQLVKELQDIIKEAPAGVLPDKGAMLVIRPLVLFAAKPLLSSC